MDQIKRLAWIFLAGFVAVMGGAVAVLVATAFNDVLHGNPWFDDGKVDPRDYQPPKAEEVLLSNIKLATLTRFGGVVGEIENKSTRKIRSFSADLILRKNGQVLHQCREIVSVDVEPGSKAPFSLLCSEIDLAKLNEGIEPSVSFNWVYPSRD